MARRNTPAPQPTLSAEQIAAAWISQNPERAMAMAQHCIANRKPATPPLPRQDLGRVVMAAFHRCPGARHGLVSIADLQDLTGLCLPQLHAAVNDLRRAGLLTVANYEGRNGMDHRIVAAAIRERDEILAFVMERQ